MVNFIGQWTIDWTKFQQKGWPGSIDAFTLSKLPAWLGGGLIDDFSATINENREPVDNYIRLIPFGNNVNEVNSLIQNGDILVCMEPQANDIGQEKFFKQRGWHAEICYKSPDGIAHCHGVRNDPGLNDCDMNKINDPSWICNIYRPIYPATAYDQDLINKLKNQINLWMKIYDTYTFPSNVNMPWFLDPADFSSISELQEIASKLLNRSKGIQPDVAPVTCIQWAYEVLCLSLCSFISEQNLMKNNMYNDFVKNWSDLKDELPQNVEGINALPFIPYTPAEAIQSSLNTYAKRLSLFDLLKNPIKKTLLENFVNQQNNPEYSTAITTYFDKVLESENLKEPFILNGAPYHIISPSTLYCEAKNADLKNSGEPWIQYIGTILDSGLVKAI